MSALRQCAFSWLALIAGCGPAVEISGTLYTEVNGADAGIVEADSGLYDAGLRERLYDGGPAPPDCPTPALASIREKVFLAKCGGASCHAAENPAEQLDLSLPVAELAARLREPAKQSASGLPLIRPGQYGGSYLYLKVFFATPTAGDQMPPGAPLDECSMDSLRDWIQAGAPES